MAKLNIDDFLKKIVQSMDEAVEQQQPPKRRQRPPEGQPPMAQPQMAQPVEESHSAFQGSEYQAESPVPRARPIPGSHSAFGASEIHRLPSQDQAKRKKERQLKRQQQLAKDQAQDNVHDKAYRRKQNDNQYHLDILTMLSSAESLQNMIIASEILNRPTDRWE
ncbi:MAG: hypothetical protein MPJ24_00930 [Pirellulaceae bacterium]|nr:hypothetical protein [Pirellulaceae bacterium]